MLDITRHNNNFGIVNHIKNNLNYKVSSIFDRYVNDNINHLVDNVNYQIDELFGRNESLLKPYTGIPKIDMYEVYIDKILLPVSPDKIEIKNKNMNKVYELVNGSEFNILKEYGLKTIIFECLLPSTAYPFALYKSGFKNPSEYIEEIKELKNKSFKLKIIRGIPYDTNIEVSLEDLSILEDANDGRDVTLKLIFKEYKPLEIKKIEKIETSKPIEYKKLNEITTIKVNNNTSILEEIPKAIVKKERPITNNKNSKNKKIKTKKNVVQTSRFYTGGPEQISNIMNKSGRKGYLETLPNYIFL